MNSRLRRILVHTWWMLLQSGLSTNPIGWALLDRTSEVSDRQ
ncbi:MAG: hypothetical protein QNJ51_15420 [Calothrix sp. MO_167.B12]|nr:hypothetical protein [Calothrix sp. MO_167.B12]